MTLRARLRTTVLGTAVLGTALLCAPGIASASPAGTAAARTASSSSTAITPTKAQKTHSARSAKAAKAQRLHQSGQRVIAEARRQRGKPYRYGGAGPSSFDCSGLVMYVFEHSIHRSLPHNAAAQFHSVQRIWHRRNLVKGDLVFVDNGGYISHVGIYDGQDHWWVAPHTGTHVQRQRIYGAHLVYGRAI
jgi:cell wall-associated NlpC family hydrolase